MELNGASIKVAEPTPYHEGGATELRKGVGVNIELGHDWMINRSFSLGVSYRGLGVISHHEHRDFHPTYFFPSLRIFGLF